MARIRSAPPAASEPADTAAKPELPAPRPRSSGVAKKKKPVTAAAAPASRTGAAGGQVLLLLGIAGSVLVTLALATYHPKDPSWSYAGAGETQNLIGPVGAWASDALLQVLGYTAWAVVPAGAALALRLAGRPRSSWLARIVAAVGTLLFGAALQLVLAGRYEQAFPPGGLLGMAISGFAARHLGKVGAGLMLGTGVVAAATILFRIDWQPLVAGLLQGVQRGAPLAVRGVGSLGSGALRASARVGASGVSAVRDRLIGGGDEAEDEEDEEESEEPSAVAPPPAPAKVSAPAAPALPVPARRAPPASVAPKVERLPEPAPELPSVWSARRPPPAPPVAVVKGAPEREAPTQVGGRTLVQVEWDEPSRIGEPPRRASAPRPEPRATGVEWAAEPRPTDWAIRASGGEAPPVVAPAVATGAAPIRPLDPPSRGAAPFEPSPDLADALSVAFAPRPGPPVVVAPVETPAPEEDIFEEPPSAPVPVPEAPRVIEMPPEAAPPRAAAPSGKKKPSGDGVSVHPGNLKSGGAADDGRAVRKTAFQLPPLSLLDDHPAIVAGADEAVLHEVARRLTETLREFQVDGRVTSIRPGPVITMYEYEPAPGVKLSRIANLADNLKMALKAVSVRIVAPLPGRGCVGIEIPNERRQTVWARDVFGAPEFRNADRTLPMILGKDTEGRPYITDLAKMPHLLVGGTTGSGKSVGVNSMLISMLFMRTPDELRMILIDPKMLEFALYEDIPHLLHPVVTEPKFASAVLKWACVEMDERYKVMARWQTRHIDTYNQKVDKELQDWTPEKARSYAPKDWPEGELLPYPKKFPYIVIVIDELADLMMVASSDVEASISRIVAKARAAGIHLIVATQSPRRDVITGLIKANMPSSLAYQVRSSLDSRVILDQNGAETLLGKGDLLFLRPGTSDLVRVHGPFLTEDEVHRVADHLRAQGTPEYDLRISAGAGGDEDGEEPEGEMDPLYDEAVELAIQKGKISTSMLQRHLGIGYNRAANIVEVMEREGVVGPADGARPREVLVGQG